MSVFARIIAGELPAHVVYEDDKVLAFLDIHPVHKGHTLIIPKEPFLRADDMPPALWHHCFSVAHVMMKQMKQALDVPFVRLYVEGTEVPHAHIHLIPSDYNDERIIWTHTSYEEWEAAQVAQTLAEKMPWNIWENH